LLVHCLFFIATPRPSIYSLSLHDALPICLAVHCLLAPDHLELARWLSVVALLVVASGWRPRLTALPHWWLTWSLSVSATLTDGRSEEHTSELQSRENLVCRLLLEKKKNGK